MWEVFILKRLRVKLQEKSYNIIIDKFMDNRLGSEIKESFNSDKIAIITDKTVDDLYGDQLKNILKINGFEVVKIAIEPGEMSKNFCILPSIYEKLIEFKIRRSDLIIALGGGVVGDLAGFVAATYLRGIEFIQIPTTLLAQVDSSVGGKVAVDLAEGKNLVGAFYHPKAVYIFSEFLNTLSDRVFSDGLAEVIKYGCIRDEEIFHMIYNAGDRKTLMESIEEIIYKCCAIKAEIVEKDEMDKGERMILNFGHTFGHAVEKYFNYDKYTHGEAVAIGMYKITKISEELGLTANGSAEMIKNILQKYNLPFESEEIEGEDRVLEAISNDKKNLNKDLNIILINKIGDAYIKKDKLEFFKGRV